MDNVKTKRADRRVKEEKKEHEDADENDVDLEAQEFIFLIDRSGSMYWGDKAINMAVRALEVSLHSLPDGSKFNIVSYGSRFETLFS